MDEKLSAKRPAPPATAATIAPVFRRLSGAFCSGFFKTSSVRKDGISNNLRVKKEYPESVRFVQGK
jgi:hypothetical protein